MQQQYAEQPGTQPLHPGLEALEDGFFMVDADWRVTYWNAAAQEMLGIARGTILGRDLWSALPFLQDSSSRDMLRRARKGGASQRYLDLFPERRPGFLSIHAAPVPQGGLAVHFRDATDEVKQAEQYSALLETIPDGFVAVDHEWRVVYVNSAAESLLRLRRRRFQEVSLWSFLPSGPAEIGECLRATMNDGVKRHLTRVRPEGRVFRGRTYDLWTYPLAGGGISILFEDVSERVSREEKLARLAREAQEANLSRSRFFAAISHELRTPLNAIVGYTHLLQSGTYGALPESAQRAADRAGVCAEHLSRLVDDLLLLTATEVGRLHLSLAPLSLSAFLPGAAEPYRLQANAKGLDFVIDLHDPLPDLVTDAARLRQLLAALFANAVKYTSRGEIRVGARVVGSEVEIYVKDTGPGIPDADRERIFSPFEQAANSARSNPIVHGSGLGLTVSRQLANLLHGSLVLDESGPDGSRFCLRLPLGLNCVDRAVLGVGHFG
jgi:PAS domain S-box-containing protein